MYFLEELIPRSNYDQSNPLHMASLENDVEELEVEFHSESDPGILLERRGNWAIATLVSESLSRKVCQGSVLSGISGLPTLLTGFDANALAFWKPPLRLRFKLSPRKMGWLTLMTNEKGRRLRRSRSLVWGEYSSPHAVVINRAMSFTHPPTLHLCIVELQRKFT